MNDIVINDPLQVYQQMIDRRRKFNIYLLSGYTLISSLITYLYCDSNNILIYFLIYLGVPLIGVIIYKLYIVYCNPNYENNQLFRLLLNNITHNSNNEKNNLKIEDVKKFLIKNHIQINTDEKCFYCVENKIDIKLRCSVKDNIHGGCIKCLSDWFSKNKLCPLCRIKIIDIDEIENNE